MLQVTARPKEVGCTSDCRARSGLQHKRSFFSPQGCETSRGHRVWLSAKGGSQNKEAWKVRGFASGPFHAHQGNRAKMDG